LSKKDIISDFSALKGKMTFSEHVCDASKGSSGASGSHGAGSVSEGSRRKANKRQPNPAGDGVTTRSDILKVGQSVVLIDSSLRGKIAAIGKKVKIELEDGLVIDAAYGEFAVTSDSEINSLKEAKTKGSKAGRGCGSSKSGSHTDAFRPAPNGTLTVDLHIEALPGGRNVPKGQQLHFQLDTFRRIIRTNISRKGLKITFVHGLGDGTLKSAIRKELDEVLPLHCTYTVGDPAVTIVTIR
jgi:uncharacterized hydantoinase/oxoprolinase family protein